jgi:hypothetical protein
LPFTTTTFCTGASAAMRLVLASILVTSPSDLLSIQEACHCNFGRKTRISVDVILRKRQCWTPRQAASLGYFGANPLRNSRLPSQM